MPGLTASRSVAVDLPDGEFGAARAFRAALTRESTDAPSTERQQLRLAVRVPRDVGKPRAGRQGVQCKWAPTNPIERRNGSMARLDISLLGPIRVTRDGSPISEPTYAKVMALLAFLAVESDRPHQRASIAGLLWPDQTEDRARHSLRQALTTLRRVVGQDSSTTCLLVSRDTITFNNAAGHSVDVTELISLIAACERHEHSDFASCGPCTQRLERAVALYQGSFLDGFSIPDSDMFEHWLQMWRQRLQDEVMRALEMLVASHERQGQLDAAIRAARRQLEIDPWLESAHRRLMTLLWRNGNRSAAMAQYERCRRLLDEELGVEPEQETTALFEEIRDGTSRPAPVATAPSKPAPVVRLPVPPTRLVGRERELDAIADLLGQQACRLLTLIGPGGSGKTRLAIQVAADRARDGTGIVCFVPLATVRTSDGIAPAIASELGLALQDSRQPDRQLLDWLDDRAAFLVLDNAEHLASRMGLVTDMLAAAPGLTVLVTSRERLGLAGEWTYEVHGLSVPKSDTTDSFEGYDAIELLGDRLRQVRSGTPLRHEERPDVIHICQLVGGMPLAIELAAAWANTLTLAQIAEGIRHNLDFLSGGASGARDHPDRHTSMRAVFNSSLELLTPKERAAYRRLSVFADGFTLDAAEAVAGTTIEALAALINKSLLTRLPSGRYAFHGLLSQFGDELLREQAEEYLEYHDQHARYYLRLLETHEDELTGRNQRGALEAIESDIDNIRAAWAWAVGHDMSRELLDAAFAFWLFSVIRGSMREGAATFGQMLDALERPPAGGAVPDPARQLARATAQIYAGGFKSGLGNYDDGVALLSDGVSCMQDLLRGRGIGLALNMLAAAHSMKGDYAHARDLLRESLEEFERIGDRWGMAFSLNDLGMVLHVRFGEEEGQDTCERSRNMFRQVGDGRGQAFAAYNLGVIATQRGEHHRAQRLHREALTLREESDDRWGVAASLVQLGMVSRLMGANVAAREQLERALRMAWESSVVPVVLDALVELSALDIDNGNVERAETALSAIASHPALSGEVRDRVEALMRTLEMDIPSADGASVDRWAVRTVDDLVLAVVGMG
jgi:predicted ATPase/DNA-binding SARP family transcriptional activator